MKIDRTAYLKHELVAASSEPSTYETNRIRDLLETDKMSPIDVVWHMREALGVTENAKP